MSFDIRFWFESQISFLLDKVLLISGGTQSRELIQQSRHPWFYSPEWQAQEAIADDDLLAGRYIDVTSIQEVKNGLESVKGSSVAGEFAQLRAQAKNR